ncbi:MAG: universal stress protein [Natrialbaceae archaeon]|nr:universal stress protein [Natrialbaceae archaeon]
MYRDILVPTDGSEAAESAVTQGFELAERFNARVQLLYVVDIADNYPARIASEPLVESLHHLGQELLDELAEAAPEAVSVETTVADGSAHEEILAHASATAVDVIVLGTHGRRGLDRFLLGSVTERCSDRPRARCSSPGSKTVHGRQRS